VRELRGVVPVTGGVVDRVDVGPAVGVEVEVGGISWSAVTGRSVGDASTCRCWRVIGI
jgi:hypothetical protein